MYRFAASYHSNNASSKCQGVRLSGYSNGEANHAFSTFSLSAVFKRATVAIHAAALAFLMTTALPVAAQTSSPTPISPVPDPAWIIAGIGDFDGDGKADILWRHASTGQNYVYLMDGTTIKATEGYLRTVADQSWGVASPEAGASLATGAQGTDFYLTYTDHLCVSIPPSCPGTAVSNRVIITGPAAASGEVRFNGTTTPFTITAGGQSVVTLPANAVLTSNETVEAKAIRVTSSRPVSVYAVAEYRYSADGYLAVPTSRLGTRYLVMSRGYPDAALWGSAFAIAATQDGTTVTITPAAAGATKPAATPYDVALNAGQTYQLTNPATGDMTGSIVLSDKPIAVFGGHRCIRIPIDKNACDYLVEQLVDTTRAGTKFRIVPFSGRTRYTVRVMATAGSTTLTCNPVPAGGCAATIAQAGGFVDMVATSGMEILASEPVIVAQLMHGYDDQADNLGDPSMVLVTPEEHAVADASFAVHGLAANGGTYINVVIPTAAVNSVRLDGAAVDPALFSAMGSYGFSGAAIAVTPGPHRLRASAPFTAMVYGYGADPVSYAYPAASSLAVTAP